MKTKLFFVAILLIAVFCVSSWVFAQTMTDAQRQALMAQIQQQINLLTQQLAQLLAQQQGSGYWCYTFNTNLGFVNSGTTDVVNLHLALQQQGFSYSPDDVSTYSTGTVQAVIQFQAKYGISPQTGYVGTLTRTQLNNLYACTSSNPNSGNCTPSWSCNPWNNCSGNTQTRFCYDTNSCGTTANEPATTQSCNSPADSNCTPNWSCSGFGTCINGQKTQTCADSNYCGTTSNEPSLTQSCTVCNANCLTQSDGVYAMDCYGNIAKCYSGQICQQTYDTTYAYNNGTVQTIKTLTGSECTSSSYSSSSSSSSSYGSVTGAPTLIGTANAGSDLRSVSVSGNYAYVVDSAPSTLRVFNVSTPSTPLLVNTTTVGGDPESIFVSGNYAYVVTGLSSTLKIFNISTPSNPLLVSTTNTSSNGNTESPNSIFVSGNYAYVVTDGTVPALQIFNISTPSRPSLVSATNTGGASTSVFVSGNYAYVTNSLATYPVLDTFQIFNISTPSNPLLVSTTNTSSHGVSSVFVSGNYAYVVSDVLQVFNISAPSSPSLAATITTVSNPSSISVSGNYAYVTNFFSNTLQVFNVSTPSSPYLAGTANTNSSPESVFVSGGYIYVGNLSGTLQVFSASGSSNNPYCTPNWRAGSWSTCVNGQQTRTVTDSNNCGTTNNEPAILQSCASSITCTDSAGSSDYYTRGALTTNAAGWKSPTYDTCQTLISSGVFRDTSYCTGVSNCYLHKYGCNKYNQPVSYPSMKCPNGCQSGACIKVTPPVNCTPSWQCSGFGDCVYGQQIQTCIDLNACGTTTNEPATTQSCPFTMTCTDSDGGLDYHTKGTLTTNAPGFLSPVSDSCQQNISGGNFTDVYSCSGSGCYIHEFSCDGSAPVGSLPIACPSCTDGACTGTVCVPSWQCSGFGFCLNLQQTQTCTDLNNCGTAANEPPLTQYCSSNCTPNWQTGSWGTCVNGQQTRTVTDSNNCSVTTGEPTTTQACVFTPTCSYSNGILTTNAPNWTSPSYDSCEISISAGVFSDVTSCAGNGCYIRKYSCSGSTPISISPVSCSNGCSSGACNGTVCTPSWQCSGFTGCVNGQQGRVCVDSNNCGTTAGKPATTQTCSNACTPSWQCSGFGACVNAQQTQTCTDSNNCGVTAGEPATTQSCAFCNDSDGGLDYYTKGTLTTNAPNWISPSYDSCEQSGGGGNTQDIYSCSGSNCYIHEYSCIGSTPQNNSPVQCLNGCSNGACLRAASLNAPQNDLASIMDAISRIAQEIQAMLGK